MMKFLNNEPQEAEEIPENMLRLQIDIPESFASEIFKMGLTPTEFFNKVIHAMQYSGNISKWISEDGPKIKESLRKLPPRGRNTYLNEWKEPAFFNYLDYLIKSEEKNLDPLLLLQAYVKLGPMPKGYELQKELGIEDDETWYKEFRAMKARLTIYAKNLGYRTFFHRAQGSAKKRYHPMEQNAHRWLLVWSERNENFLNIENPRKHGGEGNE